MSDDVEMGKMLNTDENLMRERHFRTLDNFYYVKDFWQIWFSFIYKSNVQCAVYVFFNWFIESNPG